MKHYKKLLILVLAGILALGIETTALAATADTGFSDVDSDAWYSDSVVWCYDNGMMTGTADKTFSPNEPLTRAMLVTILYRRAESPEVTAAPSFEDTATDVWYSDAASWACETGIATGYANNLFGTNDPITREQMVTMLWRYAGSPSAMAEAFSDADSVSAFAVDAVNWARSNEIVSGTGDGRFDPQGETTRAQATVILHRYFTLPADDPAPAPTQASKILIAYFSWSGHTEELARVIQEQTGGDLFEITPETPYTENINELSGIAMQEQRDNTRPALDAHVENMDEYDTVFIGYPCWWSDAPMPVFTFLEEYDLSGKTVVPFTTYGENVFGRSIASIMRSAPGSTLLEGFAIQEHDMGSTAARVSEWLREIGYAQ